MPKAVPKVVNDLANCKGADPNIFFPEDEKDLEAVGKALVYCSGCPVIKECKEHAMENEPWGIFGGTTARQRRSILRYRKAAARDTTN